MPSVVFTAHLRDLAPPGPLEVEGATVSDALERAFDLYPALRGYILDDQSRQRKHVAIFLDGDLLPRGELSVPVKVESEIYVLQALSGG
jgi:hypothetical protein